MAATPPVAFHAIAKPAGAACNLACRYCFYLPKASLYPHGPTRMTAEVQELYIEQTLAAHSTPEITIAWQGGEPTLMGLEFFRRAVTIEERLRRPGTIVHNSIQTNGLLLDDEWCRFLARHNFLVGISIDGPRALHDAYRVDPAGRPTFDRVRKAIELLRRHGVEFNTLTSVHAANADRPLDVYRFLRGEIGARYMQFIPIVERVGVDGGTVSERSVGPEQYGRFLISIFDEWLRRDVGRVSVQTFDSALRSWLGEPASLCVHAETCGLAPVVEHNGDVYACDHFVEPRYRLGNIAAQSLGSLVASSMQVEFGRQKRDALPSKCVGCDVRFACHGGCPKDRFVVSVPGEPPLNYLCHGYAAFFRHVREPMEALAKALRPAAQAAAAPGAADAESESPRAYAGVGRNDACPCGSGRKFKHCHGRVRAGS